jgi:hypothetical protein
LTADFRRLLGLKKNRELTPIDTNFEMPWVIFKFFAPIVLFCGYSESAEKAFRSTGGVPMFFAFDLFA